MSDKAAKKGTKKKVKKRVVPEGRVYIKASYNNTIVAFTEDTGEVLAWSTAGASGFKGTKKSTPYAAQVAAENAAEKAKAYGMERVDVYVKGIGPGRDQAIRGLNNSGIEVVSIADITAVPHNGCRPKKQRRT
jgi:small subunit ribosomal protein S11